MRAIKIHGMTKKIQQLVKLSKQALREGAYRVASRLYALVYSALRVKQLPKLATYSRCTVPKSPFGCETGSREVWTVCWRASPWTSAVSLSEDQQRKLTDILDSGPCGIWIHIGRLDMS